MTHTSSPAALLNAAQRASLTIGLRSLEMHLRQADAWLQGAEEQGILYRRSLNLTAAQRAAGRDLIASGLAQIAALAARFDLVPVTDDLTAAIAAQLSVDWANLCDLSAEKLRRYGEVHPALADQFDADLDVLARLALALAALGHDDPAR